MNRLTLLVLLAISVLTASCDQHPNESQAAVAAADAWLAQVDQGHYGASWDSAAPYFQNAIEREAWEKTMNSTRSPLGQLVERKVKSTKFLKTLPGAPDGPYVMIRFNTSFENKASAIETVTPMWQGGEWKVSGYFIK